MIDSPEDHATWLNAFGGKYRLLIPLAKINELEERFAREDRHGCWWPKSIYRIHDDISGGWNELDSHLFPTAPERGPAATVDECIETVRLALIGGGKAVIDGKSVRIDAARANRIVEQHFLAQPLEQARRLAGTILAWVIMGPPKSTILCSGEAA